MNTTTLLYGILILFVMVSALSTLFVLSAVISASRVEQSLERHYDRHLSRERQAPFSHGGAHRGDATAAPTLSAAPLPPSSLPHASI